MNRCNLSPYCAMTSGHDGVCLDGAALTISNLTAERDAARAEVEQLAKERDALLTENTRLRVKNKFLREKVGYFRDDIEDGLAGRDGSTGTFALPGSGSTPGDPSLGNTHAEIERLTKLTEHMALELDHSWACARKHETKAEQLREILEGAALGHGPIFISADKGGFTTTEWQTSRYREWCTQVREALSKENL